MATFFRRFSMILVLALLLGLRGGTSLAAATSSNLSGVTQSYNAGPAVLPGMTVEQKSKDQTTVVPLTAQDIRNMLGVVTPADDATIVLMPQTTSTQQVLVAAAGRHSLLVSTQGGAIKSGDYLTMSASPGISMKANANQAEIIGRAAASFNGSNSVGSITLKTSLGHTTVSVGHIAVDVQLAPNPLYQQKATGLQGFLTKTASSIANKPVTAARVYLSVAVLLVALLITGTVFYSSSRTSIVAIGRNPLAKTAITRGLIRSIFAGLVIFAAGVGAVYVILQT